MNSCKKNIEGVEMEKGEQTFCLKHAEVKFQRRQLFSNMNLYNEIDQNFEDGINVKILK